MFLSHAIWQSVRSIIIIIVLSLSSVIKSNQVDIQACVIKRELNECCGVLSFEMQVIH